MKQAVTFSFRLGILLLASTAMHNMPAYGQCQGLIQVSHALGTETVGCTDVTVTSDGSVDYLTPAPCFYGPYWVGRFNSGSYTFSFSTPVSGVKIDVQSITIGEEMALEVNGVFYPISSGTNTGCDDPASIWPPGTLRCVGVTNCGWKDINISGPINSLTIINNHPSGGSAGFFTNVFICCPVCETDAGQITADRLDKCLDDIATVPPTQQTNLEANDLLQYILFSDPVDTLGSVISTSGSPAFGFNPATMSLGTTYYIAAMAGDNLGGNVDPDDPCLDFSNAIEVAWWTYPTVAFSSDAFCLVPDNCYDIMATFTGTPPYQLSGQVLSGSTVVTTFFGTYTDTNWPVNICLPINTPEGPINIVATGLSDAYCTCN